MGIVTLNFRDKISIESVASLHEILLPASPVASLGPRFMKKFYYSKLIEDGLICCDYYKYGDRIVGFITYTKYPSNFLKIGIRKRFLTLIPLLTVVFCQKPHRFIEILKVSQLERAIKKGNKSEGAILSFGVLSEYRDRVFIHRTGLLIAHELFQHVVQFFRKEAFSTIRLLVEPDNKETLLFYHYYDCKFQKIQTLGRYLIKITCKV